jgi:hypothetical protein
MPISDRPSSAEWLSNRLMSIQVSAGQGVGVKIAVIFLPATDPAPLITLPSGDRNACLT